MFHRQLETVNGNESLRAKWKHLSWESSCKESPGGPPWSHICPLCGCWKGNWAVLRAQFSRAPPLRGRGWRWVVAMRPRKAHENRDRRERGKGGRARECRKGQARRENTGVVCRKGGACQVRNPGDEEKARRGIIVQARTWSSPPPIRWNEATQDAGQQWSRPSHSTIAGNGITVNGGPRATNQNPFVVLLPPVRRFLDLEGEEKYTDVDICRSSIRRRVYDLFTFLKRC